MTQYCYVLYIYVFHCSALSFVLCCFALSPLFRFFFFRVPFQTSVNRFWEFIKYARVGSTRERIIKWGLLCVSKSKSDTRSEISFCSIWSFRFRGNGLDECRKNGALWKEFYSTFSIYSRRTIPLIIILLLITLLEYGINQIQSVLDQLHIYYINDTAEIK